MIANTFRTTGRALTSRITGQALRYQSTKSQPLKEYFVLIWDKAGADRSSISKPGFTPPVFTFAGECLDSATSEQPVVKGNAFACLARDAEEVSEIIKASVYHKEGIWDLSTAEISPLMTVHSTKLSATE